MLSDDQNESASDGLSEIPTRKDEMDGDQPPDHRRLSNFAIDLQAELVKMLSTSGHEGATRSVGQRTGGGPITS
jgi:hypothetical protein